MILNYEEIKSRGIILGFSEKEFADGSYNLTIDRIIDMDGKVTDCFKLKPQGMVYVSFNEKLKIPSDLIGFAHIKTSITKRGVMATNIGIIDPNYEGYISTLLINFGKSDCFLTKGDAALRVTFAKMTSPQVKKPLSQNNLPNEEYIKNIQRNITNLDEKFLNLNAIENQVKSSVFKALVGLAIFFTAGSFLIAGYFNFKNSNEKDLERSIKKYETDLSMTNTTNKILLEKLISYEMKLKCVQDSLAVQSSRLRKLKIK